jgi:hypothetical protein
VEQEEKGWSCPLGTSSRRIAALGKEELGFPSGVVSSYRGSTKSNHARLQGGLDQLSPKRAPASSLAQRLDPASDGPAFAVGHAVQLACTAELYCQLRRVNSSGRRFSSV